MKSQVRDSKSGHKLEQVKKSNSVVFLSPANGQIRVEPSQKEKDQLQNLYEWRVKSQKTQWVLGKPISY